MRKEHQKYVHDLLTDQDNDKGEVNKRFWTYIKHRRGDTSSITAIKTDNRLITDRKGIADALNNQFQSVFSPTDLSATQTTLSDLSPSIKNKLNMDDLHITKEGVLKLLLKLKPYKATGPDGISARVMKEMAAVLAGPLCNIFNMSLEHSSVPDDWRHANVTPIFKKGDRCKPENYRPISLTCIASKIMEHIVTSHMMKYIERNNILHPKQHGFRARLSCETQLVELVSDISAELDAGREVDACLLDFSKAFDKVNHHKLLQKMKTIGICDQITGWTASFLSGRTQTVTLQGTCSDLCAVTSGVPQGSVIGPALFLLYINDLPGIVRSRVRLFADDTIIYTTTDKSDQLTKDLTSLEEWETDNKMKFHPAKCEVIRFSRKRSKTPTSPYPLHGETIPQVKTIKYLGVKIQDDLRWSPHVEYITTRASTTLGFIKRTIPPNATTLRAKAYKQLIRPTLEYASCAWDPLTKTLSAKVEAVQRRSARAAFNIPRTSHASTTNMLQRLDWELLEARRAARRMSLFRAMHFGEVKTNIRDYISPSECLTSTRRHSQQYRMSHHNTKAHMGSFFIRTSRDWNQLDPTNRLLYCCCSPG